MSLTSEVSVVRLRRSVGYDDVDTCASMTPAADAAAAAAVLVRDRSSSESQRRLSVPHLVRSQQERRLQGHPGRVRAAYSRHGVEHLSARLRRAGAAQRRPTDDRTSTYTPAGRLDERLASVQDHTRGARLAGQLDH